MVNCAAVHTAHAGQAPACGSSLQIDRLAVGRQCARTVHVAQTTPDRPHRSACWVCSLPTSNHCSHHATNIPAHVGPWTHAASTQVHMYSQNQSCACYAEGTCSLEWREMEAEPLSWQGRGTSWGMAQAGWWVRVPGL